MQLQVHELKLLVGLGIYKWEKVIKYTVAINITLTTNEIIDYYTIKTLLKAKLHNSYHSYLESLSKYVLKLLVNDYAALCSEIEITVTKINALRNSHASITLKHTN